MMLGRLTSLVVEYLTLGFDHLTTRPIDFSTRPSCQLPLTALVSRLWTLNTLDTSSCCALA